MLLFHDKVLHYSNASSQIKSSLMSELLEIVTTNIPTNISIKNYVISSMYASRNGRRFYT